MPTERTNQPAKFNPLSVNTLPRRQWGRSLALLNAAVFVISSAFPLIAGLVKNTEAFPKWWGTLDVAIAIALAILAFAVIGVAQGKINKQAEDATYRAYRVLIHAIFAMIVVFFLFGDRIVWTNCLTGFAWRSWLLLYCLPAWLTAVGLKQ